MLRNLFIILFNEDISAMRNYNYYYYLMKKYILRMKFQINISLICFYLIVVYLFSFHLHQ